MDKKKDGKKREPYIFQVSTKPDISSYKWIGKQRSLLSTVILWVLWFCRELSLYQHFKAIYRILGEKFHFGNTDNKSGRPNIPPMFGEIYFILWTLLLSLAHHFAWDLRIFRVLAVYYLFESSVWILYYTVFRRFFEIGYSIYHELEYLTQLCLLIPTQALCFSRLYARSFFEMLPALLGAGGDDTPFVMNVMGCLLSAIVISMIISSFPTEAIKKKDKSPQTFVVGCGDVVENRLYPALLKDPLAKIVRVFDLSSEGSEHEYCTYAENEEELCAEITRKMGKNGVVWIETPTDSHVSYLKRFLDSKARLIVLEKPVSANIAELDEVEELVKDGQTRNRIFFLSYYVLEKALPLYYLTNFNARFERYLDVENGAPLKNWYYLLGVLKKVTVHIGEGEDDRAWVNNDRERGQLLETFIHNVLLASLFCGLPEHWQDVNFSQKVAPDGQHEIFLTAQNRKAAIDLYLKKNAPEEECKRYVQLDFEGGFITMDLDRRVAKIYFNNLDQYTTISVKTNFSHKYGILTDLVHRVATEECDAHEIDGFINQISTIRWLLSLKENGTKKEC